jgi:hypothetical protein
VKGATGDILEDQDEGVLALLHAVEPNEIDVIHPGRDENLATPGIDLKGPVAGGLGDDLQGDMPSSRLLKG